MNSKECLEKAAELRALDEAAAKGPWLYRPHEYDDWGCVRVSRNEEDKEEGLPGHYAASMRAGRHVRREEEVQHRENGTDPYGPNAQLIVWLRNNTDMILKLLEERK